MRSNLLLLILSITMGVFLWVTLSGILLFIGLLLWLIFVVISIGYSDTMVLYFLGAREVRSSDELKFFESASQEAYKLSLQMPSLYYYSGQLERVFVLQRGKRVSVVLSKSIMEKSSTTELSAITFELLLQVKKGMASKRTRLMFILGALTWMCHAVVGVFALLIPNKEIRQSADWYLNYLLHPLLTVLFNTFLGLGYFKKLAISMKEFPLENDLLTNIGLKLIKPNSFRSFTSKKLRELSSSSRSRHFQHIMALEFLPHEWDSIFEDRERHGAE